MNIDMEDVYREYKPLLFSIAYRMLGAVTEAEDIVQETFLTLVKDDIGDIHHMKSYLCKMVTNRCLDILKSARRKREIYFGEWLPEPLSDGDGRYDPLHALIQEESISYSLLVLMENLTPAERAVYVLRSALGCDYREIAQMLDRAEPACRKLYSRAQQKMSGAQIRVEAQPVYAQRLVEQFVDAIYMEDAAALIRLLSEDAVLISDGGGKARAAINPIRSDKHVVAFLLGVTKKWQAELLIHSLNGQPGILLKAGGTKPIAISFALDEELERFKRIFIMVNPEKMTHLF
jgi:RNA polymerase sigma-70 factor, ECF subfamily